jgi:hypothetical protein
MSQANTAFYSCLKIPHDIDDIWSIIIWSKIINQPTHLIVIVVMQNVFCHPVLPAKTRFRIHRHLERVLLTKLYLFKSQ